MTTIGTTVQAPWSFWQQRVPLTLKTLLLIGVVGMVAWSILGHLQNQWITGVFRSHMERNLRDHFQESLTRLEGVLRAHKQAVKLFVGQERFLGYVRDSETQNLWETTGDHVIQHSRPPAWLPPVSILRSFSRNAHILLLDERYRLREIFRNSTRVFPQGLYDEAFLDYLKIGGPTSITEVDGIPHYVASAAARHPDGRILAVLAFIIPFDDRFLTAFHRQFDQKGVQVFLHPREGRVMASSHPAEVPADSTLAKLSTDFLIVGQDFFNYEFSSEMLFQVATLIPKTGFATLQQKVLRSGSTEQVVSGIVFTGAFILILIGISRKLRNLNRQIETFSEQSLGVPLANPRRGDQLVILHELLQRFTDEINRSRASLTHELRVRREAEARYRNLVENTTDWVWEMDPEGRFTYCSPRSHELLGYAPEALIEHSPTLFMDREETVRVETILAKVMQARAPLETFTNINRHKSGHEVVLETNGVPFFDEQGHFMGYHGISRDVTRRVRMEESLKEANERFQAVLDGLNALVYVSDLETHELLFLNKYGQDHFGTIVGQFCWASPPDTRESRAYGDNGCLLDDGGQPNAGVSWDFHDIVGKRWYAVHTLAIRWVDERLVRLEIATDITAQKALQESIRTIKNRLEIEERKRLGNLLHESIGQSLQAIKLGLEMKNTASQRTGPDAPPFTGELQEIGEAIGLLRDITTALRPAFLERMDLAEAIQWWCARQDQIAAEAIGFRAEGEFDDLDAEVKYNCFRIFQESLTNALKHAQAGHVEVVLRDRPGGFLELVIHDDGRGMDLKHIQDSGTGLGLSIIREQAERLSGEAHFDSVLGQGTTVTVRAPR